MKLAARSDITAEEYANWQPAARPKATSPETASGPMFADGKFLRQEGIWSGGASDRG